MTADLKAAFDKTDRDKLWDCLKEEGIRESLIGEELKRSTREQRLEARKYWRKYFYNEERDVKQGCVISSLLFNLYINLYMNLDEKFRGRGIGGIGIDK